MHIGKIHRSSAWCRCIRNIITKQAQSLVPRWDLDFALITLSGSLDN